jgi:hypothetical protein
MLRRFLPAYIYNLNSQSITTICSTFAVRYVFRGNNIDVGLGLGVMML